MEPVTCNSQPVTRNNNYNAQPATRNLEPETQNIQYPIRKRRDNPQSETRNMKRKTRRKKSVFIRVIVVKNGKERQKKGIRSNSHSQTISNFGCFNK